MNEINKKTKIIICSVIFILSIVVIIMFLNFKGSSYTVTFDSLGGNDLLNQIVEDGNYLIKPENPEKEGYIFIEWQYNGETYDFSEIVDNDLTLTAVWEKVYNLNDEISVMDNYVGTLCWTYSYPTNIVEAYGVDISEYLFTVTDEEIILNKYPEETINLTDVELQDFINEKMDEISLMHEVLEYDYDLAIESYDQLVLLKDSMPEGVVNYEVTLEDGKITYGYDVLYFEDNDEFNDKTTEFQEKINVILSDAFLNGGGCGDYTMSTVLDEEICDKYSLYCDRW